MRRTPSGGGGGSIVGRCRRSTARARRPRRPALGPDLVRLVRDTAGVEALGIAQRPVLVQDADVLAAHLRRLVTRSPVHLSSACSFRTDVLGHVWPVVGHNRKRCKTTQWITAMNLQFDYRCPHCDATAGLFAGQVTVLHLYWCPRSIRSRTVARSRQRSSKRSGRCTVCGCRVPVAGSHRHPIEAPTSDAIMRAVGPQPD